MNRSTDRWLLLALILAVSLRLGALGLSFVSPAVHDLLDRPDVYAYEALARGIMRAGGYYPGHPTAYRMPGYPLFLAVVYTIWDAPLAVQLTQIGIEALTVWFVYLAARKATGRRGVGRVAALLVAVNPLLVFTSITRLSEPLVTAIFAAATLLLVAVVRTSYARRRVGLSAALFGLIALGITVRPSVLVVGALTGTVLVAFLARRGRWREAVGAAGVAVGVTVVLLLPWWVRNVAVMGRFVPFATNTGTNLYGGNNPQADGGYVSDLPYRLPGVDEVESSAILTRRALDWIVENPGDFLSLLPRKAVRHWSPVAFGTAGQVPLPDSLRLVANGAALGFYALVVAGLGVVIKEGRSWAAMALLVVPMALFASSLVFFGATRFALPSHPQLSILAASALVALVDRSLPSLR